MGYIKVVKNKAYHKRYQTKFRRRREGKTDYYARKRLVVQDKTKYNALKYRLVVRQSNKNIIAQIVYSTIDHDVVLAQAQSRELVNYGVSVGLTNYAAAYATGLLCARRVLAKLGLDKAYTGLNEANGEMYTVQENDDGPRPFCVLLDAGLSVTTTGSKVFAAMKGAVDGGLEIPHKNKRFAGYNSETKEFNAATLRHYIYGGHVADYMNLLQSGNPEKYNKHFSKFVEAGVTADGLEALYKNCHKQIRANPVAEKKERRADGHYVEVWRPKRKNNKQRKARVNQIIASLKARSAN
jgi:large subunit ribosomal protein L5e